MPVFCCDSNIGAGLNAQLAPQIFLFHLYYLLTTGVLCQLPSTKDICPGDDVTFSCNTTQIAVTWLVTPAVGNVSSCTVVRDTTPTATCGPMDVFTAAFSGGDMTSTLSAQSVTDDLNGTRVECLDVGDVDEEICIIGQRIIIESVDNICRDGADTPNNGSELPNADVLSLFRQTTCSASASIRYSTLKERKIYIYSEPRKIVKTRIVHLLSSSVQTVYRETGVSNRSNSFTKIIYTGAYIILDAQNLHTFSQSCQTAGLQPYKC